MVANGNSFWARYARSRYKVGLPHTTPTPFPRGISKAVFMEAFTAVQRQTRWIVGDGSNINFLDDVWVGAHPLRNSFHATCEGPPATVRQVVQSPDHPFRHTSIFTDLLKGLELSEASDIRV